MHVGITGWMTLMAISKSISRSKQKLLSRWFPTLSEAQANATAETLDILMDVDQVTTLLSSLDDVRHGRVVGMNSAFGDL